MEDGATVNAVLESPLAHSEVVGKMFGADPAAEADEVDPLVANDGVHSLEGGIAGVSPRALHFLGQVVSGNLPDGLETVHPVDVDRGSPSQAGLSQSSNGPTSEVGYSLVLQVAHFVAG